MSAKIKTLLELKDIIVELKRRKKKIVFTNGCFDILHIGHVQYLESAKAEGDILIVAVNSDESVQGIKGRLRPIIVQDERVEIVAALGCVDYVVIFDEPDPEYVISQLIPDLLIKGADWQISSIKGKECVEAHGGIVKNLPLVEGHSTSAIIDLILQRYSEKKWKNLFM